MGLDRLIDQRPDTGGSGGIGRSTRPRFYTEQFDELFPFYLSIGMTYELYWEQDADLVRAYRKAYELRQKVANQSAWLQGMYVYDAICKAAPYLRSLKPKRPEPYPTAPYGADKEIQPRPKQAVPATYEKTRRNFEIFAINYNKQFQAQGGDVNA